MSTAARVPATRDHRQPRGCFARATHAAFGAARGLALLAVLLAGNAVHGTEGGTGHYQPGAVATLIDLAPTKPGWVVQPIYLHYQGDASGNLPVAGTPAAELDVRSDAVLFGGLYTFELPAEGAFYSVGAYLPYVWMRANADVQTPFGTVRRRDTESGFGDLSLIPAMLAWKSGFWQLDALLPIYAPIGSYEEGRLANPGLNYWTFDPIVGGSYNNDKIGFNAALHVGVSLNTENHETDYESGSMLHLEGSVQQLLPLGPGFAGLGAEVFYLNQISGDDGSGATFGDFEGRSVGVGPVLSYVLPLEASTFVAEFRWLPELDVQRRVKGDFLWLKLVYQF